MRLSTRPLALLASVLGLAPAALAQPTPPPPTPPVGVVTVDGTLTDSPYTLLATDGGRAGLGFGPNNQLNAIYAHVDPATSRLTIGLAGILERNADPFNRNYAVVFLDTRAGGFGNGNFGRTNGPDNGQGVSNFNDAHVFDAGFTADYALQIGCGPSDCFVSLFTLAGTAAGGGGSNLFIGNNADADVEVVLPSADPNSRTQGAEVSLSFSADGTGADLALDRNSVQAFAFITGASGFLSDQFLSPTDASDGNYGFTPTNFENEGADPVSYVFQPIAGRKGWRQLAWPVTGGTVADFASQNHVQGPGTSYPDAASNVILRYAGGNYQYATGLADPLVSGRGELWYHYDAADFPNGPAAGFRPLPYVLRAGGVEPQADVTVPFTESSTGFVMAGNPFSLDLDTQGITDVSGSGLQVGPLAYVWDPDAGTAGAYVAIDRNAPAQADRTVAPMQGMWLEGRFQNPTFGGILFAPRFAQASRVQGNEPIIARLAAQRVLGFQLDRLTESGPVAEWLTARLAFVDGAGEGNDSFDGGLPPAIVAGSEARIAFAGGDEYRGQESRSYEAVGPVEVPLALLIEGRPAGATYRLSWPTMREIPAEWALSLHDGDTGATVDLRTADHLDFTASPTAWTERFTVRVAPRSTASETAPAAARLSAARPYPATDATRLALTVDRAQPVRADLFDALGRHVAVVFDGAVEAARDLTVDTRALAPGVYVLRVVGDSFAESRTVTVAR